MNIFNPRQLLKNFINSGFTIQSISKATGIPEALIDKYQGNANLTQEEIKETEYLTIFTSQLYHVDVTNKNYLSNLAEILQLYFGISEEAISKYIGLKNITLSEFLSNPKNISSHENCAKRLVHLYITYMRDKKHS